jgi:hypothetical protein
MKGMARVTSLAIAIHFVCLITPQSASAQLSVSFQFFYDNLSPHGTWVDHPNYGYAWTPRGTSGFRPYGSQGHWAYTDAGWTWVSNYSWGWAPFHYGRWFHDPYYGWLWVPDYEWGPGWVSWRRSAGYYGWAPIGPGVEIDFAYSSGYDVPSDNWRFVRENDFGRTNLNNYYLPSNSYADIIRNSQPIRNIQTDNQRNVRYNAGPDRAEVEKRIGKPITPLVIKERNSPGQNVRNNSLEIYRPQVQKTAEKRGPLKVIPYKKVQPAAERPQKIQPIKQPEKKEPQKQQPVKSQPTQERPKQQPVKQRETEPARKQQNPRSEPTQPKKEPQNQQPTKQKPVKNEPQPEKKTEKNTPPKKGNG